MKIIYPAIFHYENNAYWVEFPDLDGCFSDGETRTETFLNAKEALELQTLYLLENGKKLPKASEIEDIKPDKDSFVSLVDADLSPYLNKAKAIKKTLTIPRWLNDAATQKGINFSQTLQEALMQKINAD